MDIQEYTQDSVDVINDQAAKPQRGLSNLARILILILGDVIVFLIFSAIGRRSHGEASGLDAFSQIVLTATPFALGWFLVSPFVGAFRRGLEIRPRAMATRTALAWVAAWPVGLLIRGLIEQKIPPLSFALVTLISNMVFLLLWRWPLAFFLHKRKRS